MKFEKSTRLKALKVNLTTKFKLGNRLTSLTLFRRCNGAFTTPFKKETIDWTINKSVVNDVGREFWKDNF
jgi:hypothetical protein